jgi:5-oxoprolinase (ATP-hydrolysing) subunit C
MSLTVLEPGPYSLVVDLGRPRHRSLGAPLGGAADRAAFIQGNALVGNSSDEAALEFALAGPTLRANADFGCVIFGVPFDAWIDDRFIHPGIAFNLKAGEILHIGSSAIGMHGYLCIAGGIQAIPTLDSRTAFDPLNRHDTLTCLPGKTTARSLGEPVVSHGLANEVVILRCIPGTQTDWFDARSFFGESFTVSPASNRMGLRLTGKPLVLPGRELVSEPVCPGTVQVVNDGQCIILGVDGQTIGGYPKIAHVIAADIDRLGQLRPEQVVRFQTISLDDAEVALRNRAEQIQKNIMRLQVAIE